MKHEGKIQGREIPTVRTTVQIGSRRKEITLRNEMENNVADPMKRLQSVVNCTYI